jgi:radical SAM superfamily enzyme YgiQ (UPF0313 family)
MARGRGARRAVLISIDPWTDDSCDNRPFNYAVRKVQAAALADAELADWELEVLDLRTKDVDDFLHRIEAFDPDFVGASTYVWSFPTFIELSRRLKDSRPDRTIVFGGPSARPEMFELAPFREGVASVDALVVGEGEEAIRQILGLADRSREALREIPGLAVSTGSGWLLTRERPLPPLDTLASPYVMGLVGGDPANPRATGHLETFRGCPLSCTFCQWGDLSGKSNRVFSKDYLVRELRAFQDNYLRHVFIIDAALNLNQRAFRNLAAAEREVGFFRQGHLITEVYPSHITDEHIEFIAAAKDVTLGVGVQSLDKQVLDGVERPFDEARFRRVMKDLIGVAPRTTIELIVGLPGDSPERFRETLDRALELGCGVRVYRCLVLPNALMTRAPASFRMEFDPYTLKMQSCLGWSRQDLESMLGELADRVAVAEEGTRADNGDLDTFTFHVRHSTARVDPSLEAQPESVVLSAPAAEPETERGAPLAQEVESVMERAIEQASSGAWRLAGAAQDADRVLLRILSGTETNFTVEIRAAGGSVKAFRVFDGVAFSYQSHGATMPESELRRLDTVAQRLRKIAGAVLQRTLPQGASAPRGVGA